MYTIILDLHSQCRQRIVKSGRTYNRDPTQRPPRDECYFTHHFLGDFMKRNHLVYRCVRVMPCCEIRPDGASRFHSELLLADRNFLKSYIISADESMWLVFWQRPKRAAETGAEAAKADVNGDRRAVMTLIGSLTASRDELPLFLVAKGLTKEM